MRKIPKTNSKLIKLDLNDLKDYFYKLTFEMNLFIQLLITKYLIKNLFIYSVIYKKISYQDTNNLWCPNHAYL